MTVCSTSFHNYWDWHSFDRIHCSYTLIHLKYIYNVKFVINVVFIFKAFASHYQTQRKLASIIINQDLFYMSINHLNRHNTSAYNTDLRLACSEPMYTANTVVFLGAFNLSVISTWSILCAQRAVML